MDQSKAKKLVAEARKIARQADSWISLSNALTDPRGGLISRYFPDRDERQAFLDSVEYQQLNDLLREAIGSKGVSSGSAPRKRAGRS